MKIKNVFSSVKSSLKFDQEDARKGMVVGVAAAFIHGVNQGAAIAATGATVLTTGVVIKSAVVGAAIGFGGTIIGGFGRSFIRGIREGINEEMNKQGAVV